MLLATTDGICRNRPDRPLMRMNEGAPYIKRAGFDALDANFFFTMNDKDAELKKTDWEDWAKGTREQMDQLSLPVTQSHAPVATYILPNEKTDEMTDLLIERSFIASRILGAQRTVMHPMTVPNAAQFRTCKALNVEYFKKMLDKAAEQGVSIVLENMFDTFNFVGDHGGKPDTVGNRMDGISRMRRRYCSFLDELLDLADTLHETHPNVGVCLDFGHANEMGIDACEALRMMGKRLLCLHVNDNYAVFDDHQLPFHGTINKWEDIMKTLKEIGYDGELTYETGKFARHVPTCLLEENLRYQHAIGRYLLGVYDHA